MQAGYAILDLANHTFEVLKRYTVTLGLPYEGISPGETLCCGGPNVQWSPSGEYLLVSISPSPGTDKPVDLMVIDVQRQKKIFSLTEYGADLWAYSTSWSPDNRWVVYVDGRDRSLWMFTPSNDKLYQIMREFCCEGTVAWRP